jgi:hypothetical protein
VLVAAVGISSYVALRRTSTPTPAPLASIKPSQSMKAHISVPDLNDGSHAVIAELLVPSGYYMAMWGNEVTFRRSADPTISLRSLATVEGSPGFPERPPVAFIDRTCGGVPQGHRLQDQDAKEGWSVVCRGETQGKPLTVVVRDLRALGNEVQCVVTFADFDRVAKRSDAPAPSSDHGNPSPPRVADALAICGSLTLRTLREDELHENWNGHEWVTSSQL